MVPKYVLKTNIQKISLKVSKVCKKNRLNFSPDLSEKHIHGYVIDQFLIIFHKFKKKKIQHFFKQLKTKYKFFSPKFKIQVFIFGKNP